MLREKAKDLGKIMKVDFDQSPSWVTRWQERNLIVFKRKHGEKQDHDSEAAENWMVSVWPKIHRRYSASEIYNCNETGLYFRALPEGTFCFKNEKLSVKARLHYEREKEHFVLLIFFALASIEDQ